MGKNLSGFQDKWKMVFCFQIFLAYCEKKIDRLIEKNFWNSRLNAEYLQTFWDHKNNLFKQWKASTITVKSRLVAHPRIFRSLWRGIWCLCTVTFGQKVPKLNSRQVYCSRLYGIENITTFKLVPGGFSELIHLEQFKFKLGKKLVGI